MGICCSDKVTENPKKRGKVSKAKTRTEITVKPAPDVEIVIEDDNKTEEEKLREQKATILIQKWFRIWVSKLKARRELAWCIFQKVEYYEERNLMVLNQLFRILIEEFTSKSPISKTESFHVDCIKRSKSFFEDIVDLMPIPKSVKLNISPPFSVENLKALIEFLKKGKNLHPACVINLLVLATKELKTKSNFNEVSTSVTNKITIVGDLHGNLADLLMIFYKNDIPSLSNPYVFNGDIVDRGPNSIEVAMILCYCLLLFPNHVHLNRGNHEDPHLSGKYGLMREISTKYPNIAEKIFTHFKSLFRQLPFGTIINHKLFVVHGGISDITDLDIITDISRSMFHSVIKPPRLMIEDKIKEWDQVIDLLWSDPVIENGCTTNNLRGGGKLFGPDVTEKFLQYNHFELLIRSHACKREGYEYHHSGKVLTIFSSSNYYHSGSNKGAYMIYTGDLEHIRLVQFISNVEKIQAIKFKENIVSMEERVILDLKSMIFAHRHQLLQKWAGKDIEKTGKISMVDYGSVLGEILCMKLPWRLLQPSICKKDKYNLIIYASSFDCTKESQEENAADTLYKNMTVLETIFRAIDKYNTGSITMAEFSDAMSVLRKHTIFKSYTEDINNLEELIDIEKDGVIDIDEFFEAFKLSLT